MQSLPRLLKSLELDVVPEVVTRLERLVDELLRWNRRRNLTAITARDEILEKHLVDSLTLLPFVRSAGTLLDIGSGAGFPALPLKVACPGLDIVSVDSVGKKIDFQRHVARVLYLEGFTPVHSRIETLSEVAEYRGAFDIVTARALCALDELVLMAKPFLAVCGSLVAMKGPEGLAELATQRRVLEEDGWTVEIKTLKLPLSAAERCLIELKKQE